MTIDTNTVSNVVATIGAIAAAGYSALPLLLWRRKLNLDALHTVASLCEKVVAAMEQTQSGAPGDAKKALALQTIETTLSSLGITVPQPFIDAALEAAVLALGSHSSTTVPAFGSL